MKKITAIITLFIISNVLYSQSNGLYVEKKVCLNAIEYNDYIVDLVVLTGNAWSKAMDATNLSTAMKANKYLKSLSGKIIISLGKLQGYEGDVNFKNSAINYITHMNSPNSLNSFMAKEPLLLKEKNKPKHLFLCWMIKENPYLKRLKFHKRILRLNIILPSKGTIKIGLTQWEY